MPANILNLPCYKVLSTQENEHGYHIDVETLHQHKKTAKADADSRNSALPKSA